MKITIKSPQVILFDAFSTPYNAYCWNFHIQMRVFFRAFREMERL